MADQEMPFEERKWRHELEIEERKWKYEKNREDAQRAHDKSNRVFHVLSFLFALTSLSLFIVGMWTTSSKVSHLIESRSVSRPAP